MTASIYLTSAEGRTGKSAVALGVLDALLVDAPRVGVFRPIVRSRTEPDRVLELLRTKATAALTYEQCIGVTYDEAHADSAAALATIVAAYQSMKSHCDAVLVVGSDYTDVAAPTELAFNARIAANLDTPVMLILGGREHDGAETLGQSEARSAADIAHLAELAAIELRAAHASLVAVLVNRADGDELQNIVARVSAGLDEHVSVWALPEKYSLISPTAADVLSVVDGTLMRGSRDALAREVRSIVIAGMSMEHVLPRLIESSVVVIAADRSETLLAVTMAHEADTFANISAVVLNGDFELSPDVQRLLDGIGSPLPIIRTSYGTFETAQHIMHARGLLTAHTPERLDVAVGVFREHVDVNQLRKHIQLHSRRVDGVRTPTMFAYELFERAAAVNAHIVLPEGEDERILRAANTLLARSVVQLTLLGNESTIRTRARELGLKLSHATIIDPKTSPWRQQFIDEYVRLRKHKGVTAEIAEDRMNDVNYFGTMMVQLGFADGMVSGAAHTTAETLRPSLEIIKAKPGISVVSSVFFMALADRVLVYGDCAVVPEPTAEQLADIAVSSAITAAQFGVHPRIAMLSYSTGQSGSGHEVEKVRKATALVREAHPELSVDGPMQYDAASDPVVGAAKLPESEVAGRATVFIFPDLNTGNNTYKAVQRSAGAIAVGPVLQGLNKPVNDLSRGATIDDILNTVAITAVQAGAEKSHREHPSQQHHE